MADELETGGKVDEALAAYTEAITWQPGTAALYRNRAETLIRLRRLEEAEADLTQAVALDGHEENPYLWERRTQLALARGNAQQAEEMIAEALRQDPTFDLAFEQAQCAWLRGDLPTAQAKLQQACEQTTLESRRKMRQMLDILYSEHSELPHGEQLQQILEKDQ